MLSQYDALTRSHSFSEFASTSSGGIGLEQIHNAVHWDGACGGQFLSPDFSAFDPLLYAAPAKTTMHSH